MFLFMPYIHYERVGALRRMQDEIALALQPAHKPPRVEVKDPASAQPAGAVSSPLIRRPTLMEDRKDADKKLIGAHVYPSNASMHVRRTLDQSFYRTIDTTARDKDQVILRYQKQHKLEPERSRYKLLMVDQLWMWIIEGELLITSFPRRWEQEDERDPDDLFKSLLSDLRSPLHEHVSNIYELAMFVASHCAGMSDLRSSKPGETLFLDMFDAAIGKVTDSETDLFRKFESASEEASEWLKDSRKLPGIKVTKSDGDSRDEDSDAEDEVEALQAQEARHLGQWSPEPPFIHTLLDINSQTKLTKEIKDIQDELGMLHNIFVQQQQVCDEAHSRIDEVLHRDKEVPWYRSGLAKVYEDLTRRVQNPLKDIRRMQEQSKQNYDAIKDLLDLKQKYANAMQAADVARQSQTILVFTIVTVLFLPLSFLAAFFALQVDVFPRNQNGIDMPLHYVLKYVVGVGLVVSLPFILVALCLKKLRWLAKGWRKRFSRFRARNVARKNLKRRRKEEDLSKRKDDAVERRAIATANDNASGNANQHPLTSGHSPGSITQRLRRVFKGQSKPEEGIPMAHLKGSV